MKAGLVAAKTEGAGASPLRGMGEPSILDPRNIHEMKVASTQVGGIGFPSRREARRVEEE